MIGRWSPLSSLWAIALVSFALPVSAQTKTSPDAPVAAVEAAAPKALARQKVQGVAVAMVLDGVPVWSAGFGTADATTDSPVTADSVFEIASLTKPVTAWAILKLVEEGRMDLDTPIETYLGGWTLPPSEFDHALVTPRSILAHGAGLAKGGDSGVDPGEPVPPLREAMEGETLEYGPVRVDHAPGQGYHYSSKGFTLLELAVETVTGEPFAEYVAREILQPLGMEDSAFGWTPELEARAAWGHDWYGRKLPHYRHATFAQGGLVATAEDVAKFVAASMAGGDGAPPGRGVVSLESVNETFKPFPYMNDASTIGLGYNLHLDGDTLVARKSGDHRGYKAILFAMPEIGAGLVVLANSDRAAPGIYADIACPWSVAMPGNPLKGVCRQLLTLRAAHWAAGGIGALIGATMLWVVFRGVRGGVRAQSGSLARRVSAGAAIVITLLWWGYWYSDIPLQLQGFPPTFYTVRATLWPTAFVVVSLGLTALIGCLAIFVLYPRVRR